MLNMPDQNIQPIAIIRTRAQWQRAVLALEATQVDSDKYPFAYWVKIGYQLNLGRLAPKDVDAIAEFAEQLQNLINEAEHPTADVRSFILGALTYAYARTNEIREVNGELPL